MVSPRLLPGRGSCVSAPSVVFWLPPGEVSLESAAPDDGRLHPGTFVLCKLGWAVGILGNVTSSRLWENLPGGPVPPHLCILLFFN